MKRLIHVASVLSITFILNSCTGLDEKYDGNLTGQQLTESDENLKLLYNNVTASLKQAFQNPLGDVIALSELTTDELICPTRAGNWGDNGVWRQLHQHGWDADHVLVSGCFNDLNAVIFNTTELLRFNPEPQQRAAVLFYRAFAMYWELDFFDQIPYRDPGESTLSQARSRKGIEAFDYIVDEINAVIDILPEGDPRQPTKSAARVLLMKCYLNKAIYTNRSSPSFDVADMNMVIRLADEVVSSNQYTFSANYFDNFAPSNTIIGHENILTQENVGGSFPNSLLILYNLVSLHYFSTPGGFNGWATTSDFYDNFESSDLRRGQAYNTADGPPNPGNRINTGFLIGQQYNLFDDQPLINNLNQPVVFTKAVKNIETGADLELTGIRPQKYPVDFANSSGPFSSPIDNDWVYFRLPDVLLMKAEAILRGGSATSDAKYGSSPLEIVNKIRTQPSRAASALSSVDLNSLFNERGRELWLEGWRRQDMIRFGKFLEPFDEKESVSDAKYLVFPIPNQQIAVNKNLKQNPGY